LCAESEWINHQINKFDVLLFDSYQVPFQDCHAEEYSFGNFTKRELYSRECAKKYIYHGSEVIANSVHFTRTLENETLNKVQAEVVRLCRKMRKKWVLSKLATLLSESISKTREVKLHEGYFLHYEGITTNWKGVYYNRLEQRVDQSDLADICPLHLERIREISKRR
jgi:hypothetical protein